MLGRLVNQALKRVQPDYPWGDTLPLFHDSDLCACNLECVLSDRGRPWSATPKVFHFRSDAKNIDVLRAASIDLVSLANNHVFDYDDVAMLDMLAILERAGVAYAGAGRNRDEARRTAVVQHGATRVGMLAMTDNEPEWEATPECPGTFYTRVDVDDVKTPETLAVVSNAARNVDLLIVSVHWGPNWDYQPPPEHVAFGRALIDAGADVVFGHSPHVFRGIELYRGKPILYSAGDFVDDYAVDEVERNDESFVFVLETDGRSIREVRLYPTVIRYLQAKHAEPEIALLITGKMQSLCRQLGTEARWHTAKACLTINVPEAGERAA